MPLQYPFMQTTEARASDQMGDAASDRLSAEGERPHVTEDQAVLPSPAALHLATAAIRRGYILPETTQHPVVQFECANLALLIMAWGLAPTDAACRVAPDGADTQPASPAASLSVPVRMRSTRKLRPAVEKAKIEDAYLSGLINWDKKRGLNRLGTPL